MARTVDEIQTEIISIRQQMEQMQAQLTLLNDELYLAKYGFNNGEGVELDGAPGTVWFDGLFVVFQYNGGTSSKVYLKDGSKLKKKV